LTRIRRHEVLEDRRFSELAEEFRALRAAEFLVEDVGANLELTGIRVLGKRIELYTPELEDESHCGSVEQLHGFEVEVRCSAGGLRLLDLYTRLTSRFASLSAEILGPRVFDENEWALIVLEDGSAVLLEGFPGKSFNPVPDRTAFASHTHPRGAAVLSKRDGYSMLDVLSRGAVAFCVHGATGIFCVYRSGPLLLEDYEELMIYLNRGGEYIDPEILRSLNLKSLKYLML